MKRCVFALLPLVLMLVPGVEAQEPSITLAEAIRLAEQVQPDVVRASSAVRTAGAQQRTAWGSFLPNLSVSSTAGDFFAEGPPRIDPVSGLVTSGNTTNRS